MERTPLPRLATIFVGVAAVVAEIFLSLYIFMFQIKDAERELSRLKTEASQKKADAVAADDYEKRIEVVDSRLKVIRGLQEERTLWTPVLDHLYSPAVLPDNIWLTELEVETGTDKPGKGKMAGYARGGKPMESVGIFIANMKNDAAMKDIFQKVDFGGTENVELGAKSKKTRSGAEEIPATAAKFSINLETAAVIKPPPPKKTTKKK
ncbi:MAG: hypothetical protein JW909_12965 [Planctomycetes bacterium]|nr:hypothetical protein [Planctomycetota bacterium]